jgi:mono/diheme cytochrome c family protein
MCLRVAYATLLLVLGIIIVRAQEQARRSTRDGVYTDSQAARGQASFKKACASCHGAALDGSGGDTPALTGEDFAAKWSGQTVDDLFEEIQASMPQDRPGKLARTETADIVAYILQFNKLPTGSHDLPTVAGDLKQIRFEMAK